MDYDEIIAKAQEIIRQKRFDPETRAIYKQLKTSLMGVLYEAQGGRCFYCEVPMDPDAGQTHHSRLTREHRVPKSLGSSWIDSPVLSCFLCNSRKSSLTEEEFLLSDSFMAILRKRYAEGIYGKVNLKEKQQHKIRQIIGDNK